MRRSIILWCQVWNSELTEMKGERRILEMLGREIKRIWTLNMGVRKNQVLDNSQILAWDSGPSPHCPPRLAQQKQKGPSRGDRRQAQIHSHGIRCLRDTHKRQSPHSQLMDLNLNQTLGKVAVADTDSGVISLQGAVKIFWMYKKSKGHVFRERRAGILRNPSSWKVDREGGEKRETNSREQQVKPGSHKPGQEKMPRKDTESYGQENLPKETEPKATRIRGLSKIKIKVNNYWNWSLFLSSFFALQV